MGPTLPVSKTQVHVVIGSTHRFSHLEKAKVIGAHLIKRGYPVTILAGPSVRDEIESIGAFFAPMQGRAGGSSTKPEFNQPPPPWAKEMEVSALTNFFIGPIPDEYKSVQDVLKALQQEGQTNVIYMDDIICGAMLPVYLGAPGAIKPNGVIKIGTTPIPHETADTATWTMGIPPQSAHPASVGEMWETKKDIYRSEEIQQHFVNVLREMGVPADKLRSLPRFMHSQGTCCDAYLALSIPEFEYPRSDAPESIHFVGALPTVGNVPSSLPEWWDEVIHAQGSDRKPIVVVSQGAVNNDPTDLILPTIEALKDEDVTVIATLVRGPKITADLPSNVKLADFIPFDTLLQYTDVLVSNGGYGTVQMALSLAVPMVLAGVYLDKYYTNSRAAAMGAAINLGCERVEPGVVKKAVCSILSDQKRKEQCLGIKGRYAEYNALDQIVAFVDELAQK
ncbi:UDP-Glycosyltransferase/glycogen phosphorylase [Penicillium bovifimosum]|uniref:UDP-Glycosyltransferase/glycogen phosphorylase n=1 Tax=Penicillium bovifimosum TaxID=126998 RepID=A0A9W9HFF8_9EURO|nr:UDP-Glycosyltransferase/glycogen phosphorylase [Penicillium bovifimosum]KAJ5146136.1 UDP-Glycosyltransferase/glycogen phosphorylase [Penicillium bovifimosum]